jgi:hypothetical protein
LKKEATKVAKRVARPLVKRVVSDVEGVLQPSTANVNAQMPERSALGKVLGGVGSFFGKDWGKVGDTVGDAFSSVLGWGDYEVKENSVISAMSSGTDPPVMHTTADSVIIRHREYITDVLASTAFTTTTYAVNPGLRSIFPWLSNIAINFAQYRIRGLVFEYKSTSSEFVGATNPAMGSVMLASQYNVYAPAFANKVAIDNNEWTTSAKPSQSFIHPVECAPNLVPYNQYFVRSGLVPNGQDARLFDMLYFTVATNGQQTAGSTIGEVWATYEIELFKPIMTGMFLPQATYLNVAGEYTITVPGSSDWAAMVKAAVVSPGNTVPPWVTTNSLNYNASGAGTFYMYLAPYRSGTYKFTLHITATSGAFSAAVPIIGFGSNGIYQNLVRAPYLDVITYGNSPMYVFTCYMDVNPPYGMTSSVVTISNFGTIMNTAGGPTIFDVTLEQVSGSMFLGNTSNTSILSSVLPKPIAHGVSGDVDEVKIDENYCEIVPVKTANALVLAKGHK